MYIWIFVGSYIGAAFISFFFMSQHAARTADQMRANGIPESEINRWYSEIGAATLAALIRATLITGTALGCIASLIAWLVTK